MWVFKEQHVPQCVQRRNDGFLCYCRYGYAHCHEPCISTNLSFLLKDRRQGGYPQECTGRIDVGEALTSIRELQRNLNLPLSVSEDGQTKSCLWPEGIDPGFLLTWKGKGAWAPSDNIPGPSHVAEEGRKGQRKTELHSWPPEQDKFTSRKHRYRCFPHPEN